jgi:hypothetical protein
MTDDDKADREKIVESIIDGTPIVAWGKKVAATHLESAFGTLGPQFGEMIKKNQQDLGLSEDVDKLTKELIDQLRKQAKQIFSETEDENSDKK